MKKLKVTIETAWVGASEEVEIELTGDESEAEIEEIANEEFSNYCSYGFTVVDE